MIRVLAFEGKRFYRKASTIDGVKAGKLKKEYEDKGFWARIVKQGAYFVIYARKKK